MRDGVGRRCPGCGFDYWEAARSGSAQQVAALATAGAATVQPVRAARRARGPNPAIVFGGLLGAAVIASVGVLAASRAFDIFNRPNVAVPAAATPERSEVMIDALLATTLGPNVTFAVDYTGSMDIRDEATGRQVRALEFSGQMEIAGDDSRGTSRLSVMREPVTVETVSKDGVSWARMPGGEWEPMTEAEATPSNPFALIRGPQDLRYMGEEVQGGRVVEHFRTDRVIGLDALATLPEGLNVTNVDTTFDLYTDSEAVPLFADWEVTMEADDGGSPGRIEMRGEYRFSRWGEPIVIEAPTN